MSMPNLPPLDVNQRYTINEAAAYLRVSRAYLYRLIERGELQTITDGARRFVPGSAIAARSRAPETEPPYEWGPNPNLETK